MGTHDVCCSTLEANSDACKRGQVLVCYQEGHDKVEACHCMQEGVGSILAVIVPSAVAVVIAEVVLIKR